MTNSTLKVEPISPALGAEVKNINLQAELSVIDAKTLNDAFLKYQVLIFRDQRLEPNDLVRIGRYFGSIARYPFVKGMKDHPDVIEVIKKEDESINFGGLWHTDTSYLTCPPKASLLYAKLVPPVGGDTLFASMYSAYESLSLGLKKTLSQLNGINHSTKSAAASTRVNRIKDNPGAPTNITMQASHPIVRTHPETDRKALYCSNAHTEKIEGMSVLESQPLLHYLYEQQQMEEHTFRLRWENHTLAIWDNRCTQHNAINDYQGFRREMLRVTLAGDQPY